MIIPCCVLCHAQVMSKARNTTLCASHLFFLQRAFSWEAHHKHERKKMNYVKKINATACRCRSKQRSSPPASRCYLRIFCSHLLQPKYIRAWIDSRKVSWREDVAINRSCTLRLRVKTDDALPLKIMTRS